MARILLYTGILAIAVTAMVWVRYGGGENYPDLTTDPVLSAGALEEVLAYPEPVGNVAVSSDGRVFFTVHPDARPKGNRLLEYVDGAAEPYPDVGSQLALFDTVLGVVIDRENRLWTLDHGNHGLRTPRIIAFDLETGRILRNQALPPALAPKGSCLQDLAVSADGRTVVIADSSFFRKRPALIVYDVETGDARRVLENHPAVAAENFLLRTRDRDMTFLGGVVSLRGGVAGVALDDQWLYFSALTGAGLYRVRLADLRDRNLEAQALAGKVERVADKPLSEGISIDREGNVFLTDVEHGAISVIGSDRQLRTLIRSDTLRWPDGLSFGPDGWLYVADSALPDVVLMARDHVAAAGPYRLFRFRPGTEGVPGQ